MVPRSISSCAVDNPQRQCFRISWGTICTHGCIHLYNCFLWCHRRSLNKPQCPMEQRPMHLHSCIVAVSEMQKRATPRASSMFLIARQITPFEMPSIRPYPVLHFWGACAAFGRIRMQRDGGTLQRQVGSLRVASTNSSTVRRYQRSVEARSRPVPRRGMTGRPHTAATFHCGCIRIVLTQRNLTLGSRE